LFYKMRIYTGLVHYPVYNKNREKITSAVTNLDLHDLSRISRTYGIKRFFVVTPLSDQQEFVLDLINHWKSGFGASYNVDRKEAIEVLEISASIKEAVDKIIEIEGERPVTIVTCASTVKEAISFRIAKEIIGSNKVVLLLFGTAWGLHEDVIESADYVLKAIEGRNRYNHLPVRAAAGIIIDRLIGEYT
jgi:hypothetical protein